MAAQPGQIGRHLYYRPARLPILKSIAGIVTFGTARMFYRLLLVASLTETALSAAPPSSPFARTHPASTIESIYIPFETTPAPVPAITAIERRIAGIEKTLDRLDVRLTSMEKLLLLHDNKLREKAPKE